MADSRRVGTKMSPSLRGRGADDAGGTSGGMPMNPRAVKTPEKASSLDRATGGLRSPEISSGPGKIQPGAYWAKPGVSSIGWAGEFGASQNSHALPSKTGWGVSLTSGGCRATGWPALSGHCGLSGGGQVGIGISLPRAGAEPVRSGGESYQVGEQLVGVRSGSLTELGGTSPVRLDGLRGSSIGVVKE